MKQFSTILTLIVSLSVFAQPAANHYAELDGKSGEALFQAISAASQQNYHTLSYGGLYTAYEKTDCRPNTNIIWDMYSDCSFTYDIDEDHGGEAEEECVYYNREHSIPKSWWGTNSENTNTTLHPQYTNIFHLIPTDKYVNEKRSNYPFSEVNTPTYTSNNGSKVGLSTFTGYTGKAFEPIDEYKGDLARGVLATMVQHQGTWTRNEGSYVFNGNYNASNNFGLTEFAKNLFLKWHRQDPVSQKELDRNNGIEAVQGNRNPFIDYPQLVEYIWGDRQGEPLELSTLRTSYEGGGYIEYGIASGNYAIVAQRKENTNYFYMTANNLNGRHQAIDTKTSNLEDIILINLEKEYVWTVVNKGDTIQLKNGSQFSTWTGGNKATLGTIGKDLTVTENEDGSYTLSFAENESVTRYLSLNMDVKYDYFAYYANTNQVEQLQFLPCTAATTNIKQLTVSNIHVYSTDNTIIIEAASETPIMVYNILGQCIFSETISSVRIPIMHGGMYFVQTPTEVVKVLGN